jgi:methylmalonyl-CoA mutase
VPELVRNVYAPAYGADKPPLAAARAGVERFAGTHGRAPRIYLCKLGQDGHDRGQDVVGAAFSDIGFDVVLGALFQTPDEAARSAVDHDVDVVGPSSLAAGHLTLVPALVRALADLGRGGLPIVLGGVVPPQDYQELTNGGVSAVFGPGTDLPEAALKVLEILVAGQS